MAELTQPRHIGIILDGNRRWAKAQGLPSIKGHQVGYDILRELAIYMLAEKKIEYVSAFVFSTENWQRTEEEVGYLMRLVLKALTDHLEEFHRRNIRILILGSREKLSDKLIEAIEKAESKTQANKGGTLALCFNYGGQVELADAVNSIISKSPAHKISVGDINKAIYHPEVPPLDMIIRTSGEQRLSGFMLWRAAYAELLFVQKFWPEFDKQDIDEALEEYIKRQRRYGK